MVFKKAVETTQYVADVSRALTRLEALESQQKDLAETVQRGFVEVERRLTTLEADMRVLRAEVRADVAESVAEKVQAAQRDFGEQLREVAIQLDRVRTGRLPPAAD